MHLGQNAHAGLKERRLPVVCQNGLRVLVSQVRLVVDRYFVDAHRESIGDGNGQPFRPLRRLQFVPILEFILLELNRIQDDKAI